MKMWSMILALALALCIAVQALPADSEPAIEGLRICASEANDSLRLVCYDRAMGRRAGESSDKVATGSQQLSKPEPDRREDKPQQSQRSSASDKKLVKATVSRLSELDHGELVVTLDNGQRWVQIDPHMFPLQVGDEVTVLPGALRSWWLVGPNGHVRTRVKRIDK
jgi:hypothetical protein